MLSMDPIPLEESLLSREAARAGVSLRVARQAMRHLLMLPREEREFILGTHSLLLLAASFDERE